MKVYTLIIVGICSALLAQAQNTGGVFGPVVNEGDAALQYRGAYDPESGGLAQRIHYQEALNTDFMLRGVLGTRKTDDADFDFDFFQAELFWEFSKDDSSPYRHGIRFDLALRNEDRPHSFGVNWMHQYRLDKNWSARALLLTSVDFGDRARDGIGVQTRASIFRKLNSEFSAGLELYSNYGRTDNFNDFNDQSQQIGPVLTYNPNRDFQIFAGVLYGLTDVNQDPQFRLWLTQNF